MIVLPDATDVSIYVRVVQDSGGGTPGEPATGLDHTDVTTFAWTQERTVESTFSAAALASPASAHTDGGFEEVDATNAPGLYRLDIPDVAVAIGSPFTIITAVFAGAANALMLPFFIELNAGAIWDEDPDEHLAAATYGELMRAFSPSEATINAATDASTFRISIGVSGLPTGALNDAYLVFLTGALQGQGRSIKTSTLSSGLLQDVVMYNGFTTTPGVSDRLVVLQTSGAKAAAVAVWDETITELAGVPAASPAARAALAWLHMKTRNKKITDGNTNKDEVHNDAGTKIADAVLDDAGGIFTRAKYT